MGLAASQARLLTITARLADNELRSQTINNAKMRLATQSAQASNDYVSALNCSQMMFTNTDTNGLSQKQALTFNSLTQYSQYNNQYGIVNSSGQILVSENDSEIFKKYPNDLEGFLKAHNLEWETTYFDEESSGNLAKKLTDFYSGDYAYIGSLFKNKSNEAIKRMYLDAISQDASIEQLNYEIYANNLYQQSIGLYQNAMEELRYEVFDLDKGPSEENIANAISNLGTREAVMNELLHGASNPGGSKKVDGTIGAGGPAAYSFDNIKQYLYGNETSGAYKEVYDFLNSLDNVIYPDGSASASFSKGDVTLSEPTQTSVSLDIYESVKGTRIDREDGTYYYSYASGGTGSTPYKYLGQAQNVSQGQSYTCGDITIVLNEPYATSWAEGKSYPTAYGKRSYVKVNSNNWIVVDGNGNKTSSQPSDSEKLNGVDITQYFGVSYVPTNSAQYKDFIMNNIIQKVRMTKYEYEENDDGSSGNVATTDYTGYFVKEDSNGNKNIVSYDITNKSPEEMYAAFAIEYFKIIMEGVGYFDHKKYAQENDGVPALGSYTDAKTEFMNRYNFIPANMESLKDFEQMIANHDYANSSGFNSVLNSYLVEKMVDVLGEPKYSWVDKSGNKTENADAKAQWLTNLFNRMQKGYKVLENGLASSKEWMEYAFESGLVTMEQVDLSRNWVALDYKSCSSIYQETDNSTAVAVAEAKYNRAMNDIKQKDSMYDLQLKNIDTEHSSLQTEYDVIKGVINKNIERTMKFNQNA